MQTTLSGKTDLTFLGFDNSSHPSTPWYYSHALETESERQQKNILVGVPDRIYTRVYNKGTQTSKNARVTFGFYDFTAGSRYFHDIGSVTIPPLPPQTDHTAEIQWTPPELSGGKGHGCIRATIDYGLDSNFADRSNVAQKNVQIKQALSPAIFTFRVENPLPTEAVVDLTVTSDEQFSDWQVSLQDIPDRCARTFEATITPPDGTPSGTQAIFFVSGRARERGGEEWVDIGGVALKVLVP
jgi:hypothetical protein